MFIQYRIIKNKHRKVIHYSHKKRKYIEIAFGIYWESVKNAFYDMPFS